MSSYLYFGEVEILTPFYRFGAQGSNTWSQPGHRVSGYCVAGLDSHLSDPQAHPPSRSTSSRGLIPKAYQG